MRYKIEGKQEAHCEITKQVPEVILQRSLRIRAEVQQLTDIYCVSSHTEAKHLNWLKKSPNLVQSAFSKLELCSP